MLYLYNNIRGIRPEDTASSKKKLKKSSLLAKKKKLTRKRKLKANLEKRQEHKHDKFCKKKLMMLQKEIFIENVRKKRRERKHLALVKYLLKMQEMRLQANDINTNQNRSPCLK